jgi:low temperature requirement protein LtrA
MRRMTGRDPDESHRAATPLELLFDLAFVAAFSQAGEQMSHVLSEGHIWAALGAFAFAMFAVCWAWMNFSWFSSAFDTDDWFVRVATMVQMIGVIILALGLPVMFHSIDVGHGIDNRTMVAGYVVMRVAMVALWVRVARQDPEHRRYARNTAIFISCAQIGWIYVAVADLDVTLTFALGLVLFALELAGPILTERKSRGIPWHAHHIAERFSLLTIIALGEGVFGTVTAVSAVVEGHGWSADAVVLVVAGIGLIFGLWWTYFMIPAGPVLKRFRNKSIGWGYGHFFIFASIAAMGAGLHVAAYYLDGEAHLPEVGVVLAVAIPVMVYLVALYGIYSYLVEGFDPFHVSLFVGGVVLEALGVVFALVGQPLSLCLLLVMLAPFVTVVGYETIGHRHTSAAIARVLASAPSR